MGIRVAGASHVLHECDLAALDANEAHLCRNGPRNVAPRSARVRLAVEAKYYTTSLPLQLGRAFLGLVRDLSSDSSFFVFNREAVSIERLLAHKKQNWDHNIVPANGIDVNRLTGALQTTFKNYKARTRR